MTNRERWIVYPLLFLTLGLVMRDKVAPPSPGFMQPGMNALSVRCMHLECQDLTVAGPDGEKRVLIGVTANQAGQLEVYGSDHTMVLVAGADNTGRSGRVQTLATDATRQVLLHSTDRGGQIAAFDSEDKTRVVVGYDEIGAGSFLVAPEGGVVPLTYPWWPVRVPKAPDQPGDEQSPDPEPSDEQPEGAESAAPVSDAVPVEEQK